MYYVVNFLILFSMFLYSTWANSATNDAMVLLQEQAMLKTAVSECLDKNYQNSSLSSLKSAVNNCIDTHIANRVIFHQGGSTPPTSATKIFPEEPVFENTSSAGTGSYKGTAAILFSTRWLGQIKKVVLNGETALEGIPYKGRPVFRLLKTGDKYSRPLSYVIHTVDGTIYTYGSTNSSNSNNSNTNTDTSYTKKVTYPTYGIRNERYAWRIPKKGPEFGSKIKIVFSDTTAGSRVCESFVVKNTSKNCRDRDDTCNRDSRANCYGAVFKPGIGPNGDEDADTGTSHGGIYLQAPHGNDSKQVTIYYN